MISEILLLFLMTILQNATFTLVSRARNSGSLLYHGIAATASNTAYILVLQKVVTNLGSWPLAVTYVLGSVVGGILTQWIAMKYFEKKKK